MDNEIEIYGLCGKMGVGKDYIVQNLLLPKLSFKNTLVMALADQIKMDCCVKHGIEYERLYGEKDEESRRMLQVRGTDKGRVKHGEDVWIKYIDNWMRVYSERGIERFVVTDLRFPDEVEWLRSKGGIIIKVEAPERNRLRLMDESKNDMEKMKILESHRSETALDDYGEYYDYCLLNDFMDEEIIDKEVELMLDWIEMS